jgi:rSAM/selenodomain-associated transferase 2
VKSISSIDGNRTMTSTDTRTRFSVIIPVINESRAINDTIDHLEAEKEGYDVEIIVVDGDSEGTTIHAIRSPTVIATVSAKGRGTQLNTGALHATGDIFLFLHADTRLPRHAFQSIDTAMKHNTIVGGAFDLRIDSHRIAYRFIDKAASLRSRMTRIPYGDQAIFMGRSYFFSYGGYACIPLMEDVELMRRIKKNHDRIHIIGKYTRTSPRRWEQEGIVRGTLRNWLLLTLYLMGVAPETLNRFYRS